MKRLVWLGNLMAVVILAIGLVAVPVFATQNFSTEEVLAKWLTVNGPGDQTRPGGWGTLRMINTAGLNAYYASEGAGTPCTWEFHPGNSAGDAWSFGANSQSEGSDLKIVRKVAENWQVTDLLVDFSTGNVGIGTTSLQAGWRWAARSWSAAR